MPRSHLFLLLLRGRQGQGRRRRRWNPMSSPPHLPPPPSVYRPLDVNEEILSRLPISVLVRLRAISRSFYSSILSLRGPFRRDPFFFLFYSFSRNRAMVYQPYRDRWRSHVVHRFPTASFGSQLVITGFTLFDPSSRPVHTMANVHLYDPFSNAITVISAPRIPWSVAVALVVSHNGSYKIVTLTHFPPSFQVYDSDHDSWTHSWLSPEYNFLENAVPFNGLLYVLINRSNMLVRFHLEPHPWPSYAVTTPSRFCVHLLVFDGTLFLVGGVELNLTVVGIEIWELVPGEIEEWRWVAAMPDEVSPEFIQGGELSEFKVCSGSGFICFYHLMTHRVVLCDMVGWSWRFASDCLVPTEERDVWLGCVAEPTADLLRS